MRWTMYYTMMTVCLMSTLGLIVYATNEPKNEQVASIAASEQPHEALVLSRSSTTTSASKLTEIPAITAGASREQVMNTLGTPSAICDTNNRWVYGSQALIFKDDRVVGSVSIDKEQAARMLESRLEEAAAIAKSSQPAAVRHVIKSRPAQKKAVRRGRAGATSWEPMYRRFYDDRPVPRGMRTTTGNRSVPQYRKFSYFNPRAIYRR